MAVAFVAGAGRPSFAQQQIIAAIQVHGNTLTPDEDVIKASGLAVGAPFSDSLLESNSRTADRYKALSLQSKPQRYASITDPTQIVVVIQIDEGPVHVVLDVDLARRRGWLAGASEHHVPSSARRGGTDMGLPTASRLR